MVANMASEGVRFVTQNFNWDGKFFPLEGLLTCSNPELLPFRPAGKQAE